MIQIRSCGTVLRMDGLDCYDSMTRYYEKDCVTINNFL